MKSTLTNNYILIHSSECYIELILMYGCMAWLQKKLEATEKWFEQKMLQASWTPKKKKSNETMLQEAKAGRFNLIFTQLQCNAESQ